MQSKWKWWHKHVDYWIFSLITQNYQIIEYSYCFDCVIVKTKYIDKQEVFLCDRMYISLHEHVIYILFKVVWII